MNLQEIQQQQQQLQQKALLSQQQTPHKYTQSQYIMNPPQLYYVNQDGDDIFVPNNYKQHLSLWNEHHLNNTQGLTQRYSMFNTTTAGIVNGCDEIHELGDDDENLHEMNGTGENDIVLIKVIKKKYSDKAARYNFKGVRMMIRDINHVNKRTKIFPPLICQRKRH